MSLNLQIRIPGFEDVRLHRVKGLRFKGSESQDLVLQRMDIGKAEASTARATVEVATARKQYHLQNPRQNSDSSLVPQLFLYICPLHPKL